MARAPAHAPARASLAAVLACDVRFFNLGSIAGGGVSIFPCGGGDSGGGGGGASGCVGVDAAMVKRIKNNKRLPYRSKDVQKERERAVGVSPVRGCPVGSPVSTQR